MELKMEPIEIPEGCNVIFGQSHFIKTVEDLYEILVGAVPGAKFGIGFCEASGHCLVRGEGNDEALKDLALKTAYRIGAGHTFIIFVKDAFPINMLNAVKMCQEVCNLFCATANPVQGRSGPVRAGQGGPGVDRRLITQRHGERRRCGLEKRPSPEIQIQTVGGRSDCEIKIMENTKRPAKLMPLEGIRVVEFGTFFMPGPAPALFWGISVPRSSRLRRQREIPCEVGRRSVVVALPRRTEKDSPSSSPTATSRDLAGYQA